MARSDTFGPSLREAREQRGLSLAAIARETKVPASRWAAMERNDFTFWPSGVFARSYVRSYARLVGLDPEETVDEFCRWFPNGDRRALRLIQTHGDIVGVEVDGQDDPLPPGGDRRRSATEAARPSQRPRRTAGGGVRRAIGLLADLVPVVGVSLLGARLLDTNVLLTAAAIGVAYYAICAVVLGRSAGLAVADSFGRSSRSPMTRGNGLPA